MPTPQSRAGRCSAWGSCSGMKPSGANMWSGNVYNAEDGKTYTGSFTMTGDNTADLKGCVMSFLCKSQTWTRAK